MTIDTNSWADFYDKFTALDDNLFLFAASGPVADALTAGKVSASIRGFGTKGTMDFLFLDGNGNIYSMRLSSISSSGGTPLRCWKFSYTAI